MSPTYLLCNLCEVSHEMGNYLATNAVRISHGLEGTERPLINLLFLIFIGPCIANIFAQYNQQDATFHNLFISVRRCTCVRRFFRPSSGAQNCTYGVRYLSDQYCYLLLAASSSIGLTNTWRRMWSFELRMMDGKPVWNT